MAMLSWTMLQIVSIIWGSFCKSTFLVNVDLWISVICTVFKGRILCDIPSPSLCRQTAARGLVGAAAGLVDMHRSCCGHMQALTWADTVSCIQLNENKESQSHRFKSMFLVYLWSLNQQDTLVCNFKKIPTLSVFLSQFLVQTFTPEGGDCGPESLEFDWDTHQSN